MHFLKLKMVKNMKTKYLVKLYSAQDGESVIIKKIDGDYSFEHSVYSSVHFRSGHSLTDFSRANNVRETALFDSAEEAKQVAQNLINSLTDKQYNVRFFKIEEIFTNEK